MRGFESRRTEFWTFRFLFLFFIVGIIVQKALVIHILLILVTKFA